MMLYYIGKWRSTMSVTTILYKLMVLYMLNRVNFTLTNAQMSEFFLNHKYTDYFSFQETISELVEAKLIHVRSNHHASRYEITKDGEETLKYFSHKISPPIMNEIDEYIKENKFKLRNEVGNIADYYQTSNLDYVVHCEVREGKNILISLDLSVPDEETAAHMCDNWRDKCQESYQYLSFNLLG